MYEQACSAHVRRQITPKMWSQVCAQPCAFSTLSFKSHYDVRRIATGARRCRVQRPTRGAYLVVRASAVETKTLKIGTRGSPLALAQAYLTRQLLQVRPARPAVLLMQSSWRGLLLVLLAKLRLQLPPEFMLASSSALKPTPLRLLSSITARSTLKPDATLPWLGLVAESSLASSMVICISAPEVLRKWCSLADKLSGAEGGRRARHCGHQDHR